MYALQEDRDSQEERHPSPEQRKGNMPLLRKPCDDQGKRGNAGPAA